MRANKPAHADDAEVAAVIFRGIVPRVTTPGLAEDLLFFSGATAVDAHHTDLVQIRVSVAMIRDGWNTARSKLSAVLTTQVFQQVGRRRLAMVAAATAILVLATGCTTSSSTDGSQTMAPLDEAALITVKQNTADAAKDASGQLSAAGVSVHSAVGSWASCADADPTFGQYTVVATGTIPVAAPTQQMDPLVAALQSAGWTSSRETAPKGNELADLRKSDALLQLATDGSADLQADLIGPCIRSDLIGTEGFRFSIDRDKIAIG